MKRFSAFSAFSISSMTLALEIIVFHGLPTGIAQFVASVCTYAVGVMIALGAGLLLSGLLLSGLLLSGLAFE